MVYKVLPTAVSKSPSRGTLRFKNYGLATQFRHRYSSTVIVSGVDFVFNDALVSTTGYIASHLVWSK